jgi:hypothetical protein
MYASNFVNFWKPDAFDYQTVAIYRIGGLAEAQGLGTVRQWRQPRIRVDVFQGNYDDAEKCVEVLRTFWITDFDYFNGSGAVGQGYLRAQGIKNLILGEARASSWEKTQTQYRRIMDVQIEIGD